jgi:peptidoglycan/xylan/chitin deacetylase (PgdA/CDA1 family)
MYLFSSPWWLRIFYPSLVWEKQTHDNTVYLTFDDGPHPEITPWVLHQLNERNCDATFFCIGENVTKYPDTFALIKESGHQVGNHTQHHKSGFKSSTVEFVGDTAECQRLVNSRLFRPPYGCITRSQIKTLKRDYDIVMWTVVSGDFDQNLNMGKAKEALEKNTKSGSIIVFHDSEKALSNLKELLPWYLDLLAKKGYTSIGL